MKQTAVQCNVKLVGCRPIGVTRSDDAFRRKSLTSEIHDVEHGAVERTDRSIEHVEMLFQPSFAFVQTTVTGSIEMRRS